MNNIDDHLWIMDNTLKIAAQAYEKGEVPVAAIIIDELGKEISSAHNLKEKKQDASAHAEIIALKEAAQKKGNWRLNNCTMYVTLEPCPMCLSAISQFRIKNLVFGAYDSKGGAISLGYSIHKDQRLNHKINVVGGIRHYQCSKILSSFFKEQRRKYS